MKSLKSLLLNLGQVRLIIDQKSQVGTLLRRDKASQSQNLQQSLGFFPSLFYVVRKFVCTSSYQRSLANKIPDLPNFIFTHRKIRPTRTTEAQLSRITLDSKTPTDTGHFYSCNHLKWLPYKILGKPYRTSKSIHIQNNGDMVKKS